MIYYYHNLVNKENLETVCTECKNGTRGCVACKNELIEKMVLKYKITLENGMQYDNVVTIELK